MSLSVLHQKSVVLIFAYSPAGLGHLRVTDALYEGLPPASSPLLLGSRDEFITGIHRFTSIHPLARLIFEWTQHGLAENIFTSMYRFFLRHNTSSIYQQIETILAQRIDPPKTVLIVATHFGLAHQLAAIKKKLIKEKDINILLAVQVTDDSPQLLWYVDGADIIFVPSEKTRDRLLRYAKRIGNNIPHFVVNPYPISPALGETLNQYYFQERVLQLKAASRATIHISIPISGAAVGTEFSQELIENLHRQLPRTQFHVIAKTAPYTQTFRDDMSDHSYVQVSSSKSDRDVVDIYEHLYKTNIIALEVTKPSEQAFKALFHPRQKGGSMLLFTRPVGRQEYDNLDFLRRHSLIPSPSQQQHLWTLAKNNIAVSKNDNLREVATMWRGLILPPDPIEAAQFVFWALQQDVFEIMTRYHISSKHPSSYEIQPNGVRDFWEKISHLIQAT